MNYIDKFLDACIFILDNYTTTTPHTIQSLYTRSMNAIKSHFVGDANIYNHLMMCRFFPINQLEANSHKEILKRTKELNAKNFPGS